MAPQVIPTGLEETEPVPVPVLDTVSVGVFKVKVAVTDSGRRGSRHRCPCRCSPHRTTR